MPRSNWMVSAVQALKFARGGLCAVWAIVRHFHEFDAPYCDTAVPYPVTMLPTFMYKRRRIHQPTDQPTGRVRLVECSREMIGLLDRIGTVEGTVGDEVLVRFEEIVVQVPPEMIEPVDW